MEIDTQLATTALLGIIGLIAAAGFVGVVAGFWSMGRQGYRKD